MKKFLNFKIDKGLLHSISYVASITSKKPIHITSLQKKNR